MGGSYEAKHVVLTGGTGALGSAVASMLVERGATCHIPCFKKEELAAFPLKDHKRVRLTDGVDMSDEHAVELYYSIFGAGRGCPLWAAVNLAGGFAMGPIEKVRRADLLKQMEMNFVSCFLSCREAVRRMREAGVDSGGVSVGGRIVNVAARPVLEPRLGAGMTAYTASKAAVAIFTQALAEEVAADGIWVNAIVPSVMDTPANRQAMPKADWSRWPKVQDVAAAIVSLASPGNCATRGGLVPAYGRS
jgi:NAD(P)-dependent dehydrogenase (short-subunit alcohol dehydrogenase family)